MQKRRVRAILFITFCGCLITYSIYLKLKTSFGVPLFTMVFFVVFRLVPHLINTTSVYVASFKNTSKINLLFNMLSAIDKQIEYENAKNFGDFKYINETTFTVCFIYLLLYSVLLYSISILKNLVILILVIEITFGALLAIIGDLMNIFIIMSITARYKMVNYAMRVTLSWEKIGKFPTRNEIIELLRMHQVICDVIDLYNEIYGWVNFLRLLYYFSHILSILDTFVAFSGKRQSWGMQQISLCLLFLGLTKIIILCRAGEHLSNENDECLKNTHALVNAFIEHGDPSLLLGLTFSTSARRTKVSAARFLNIDFAGCFTVMNLIVTYGIIVLQVNY